MNEQVATITHNPTLWRTCRALANRKRLGLIGHLLDRPHQTVSEIADHLELSRSITSQYLRILNARGLLQAQRIGVYVRYHVAPDPTVPETHFLVRALKRTFRNDVDPIDSSFRQVTAFTHPRRAIIVQALQQLPATSFDDLCTRLPMSRLATRRHLNKLIRRGLVIKRRGLFRCTGNLPTLSKTLMQIVSHQV